jgi:hypothetical protein
MKTERYGVGIKVENIKVDLIFTAKTQLDIKVEILLGTTAI